MMDLAVTGFFTDYSGYGEAARRTLIALNAAGANVFRGNLLFDEPPDEVTAKPIEPWLNDFLNKARTGKEPLHLMIAAANTYSIIRIPEGRQVGYTMWETDQLHTAFKAACVEQSKIIVPSQHNQDVMREAGIEAGLVPLPTVTPPVIERVDFPGVTDDLFVFYSILTWQERKNPLGLLTAYMTNFTGYDPVTLVLKVFGGADVNAKLTREIDKLESDLAIPNPPRFSILVSKWNPDDIWALHLRGNCFVTLTRGEAYCLPALDALSVGNQVIATGYGGQLDFLKENGRWHPGVQLVKYTYTPVRQRYPYFNGLQLWAEPDILHAGACMKLAANGAKKMPSPDLKSLSPEVIGKRWLEVLSD